VLERLTFNLSEAVLILDDPIHKLVNIDDDPLTFRVLKLPRPDIFINHGKVLSTTLKAPNVALSLK
jgi:hypothetical protein